MAKTVSVSTPVKIRQVWNQEAFSSIALQSVLKDDELKLLNAFFHHQPVLFHQGTIEALARVYQNCHSGDYHLLV